MPALNFKKQFAAAVEAGKKRQTIRAERKQPIWLGDTIYLYTGMRTKQCRLLSVAICSHKASITISKRRKVKINGREISLEQMNLLAMDDGFTHFKPLGDFFEEVHGLPFHGQIIRWKTIRESMP